MHGYQLVEFIDRYLASCTDLRKSTAYYLLNKLAAEGLIDEEENQEGNRPPRRVYSLTPTGEAEFQRLLRLNLAAYQPVSFTSDIGLAFLEDIEPGEALKLLDQRREALQASLEDVRRVPPHRGSLQFVVEHQAHHLQAEIDWLDGVRAAVQSQAGAKAVPPAAA